ncbi:MAG: DNA polymerase III subunit beta [Deltaproteobacteria bacterium]|nr:DNA polymerase III subunit beta [Deltaproteobacteria bacterium]
MKFVIEKSDFMRVLQRIQGIVEKRNTMPILSNVSIEALSKGTVNITATDLEVFIKDAVAARVAKEGTVTVNARKLFEIVKEMPDETIDVEVNKDSKVTIKAGKARFNVMGLPAKDFPVFPSMEELKLEKIEKGALREMIEKTAFAVSTDETRYNINGFLLEKDATCIKMVTTDGHRLALIEKKDVESISGKDGLLSVLLPRKGVMEFKKLIDENDEGQFFLGISQKNAVMKKGDTIINIRLLEGEFPDYKKVIPKDNNNSLTADKAALLSSLKRVTILSADKIKGVRFKFSANNLVLSASSPDIGDATEEMDIEYSGDPIEMAFNAKYMIDMLDAVNDEKVTIELKDSLSPGIIRPAGSTEYTYVIMPMRL